MTEQIYRNRVVLIDKPPGITSNEAINRLKKISSVKKIGHCGTLDKAASGLLIMCTGRFTRLSTYLMAEDKEYLAEIKLGSSTDTDDAEGNIIKEGDFSRLEPADVQKTVCSFAGELLQTPPSYSALKLKGRRASDIARSGLDVELKPRSVNIHSIEILNLSLADGYIMLRVHCSKGTYIRSLARDIGEKLGCTAHLSALRRTTSGYFTVDNAATIEEIESERLVDKKFILKPSEALIGFNTVIVPEDSASKVLNGGFFPEADALIDIKNSGTVFAVKDINENLIAIADIDVEKWHIRYLNVFNTA